MIDYKLIKLIQDNLDDSLLKPEYLKLKNRNKYTGHCYTTSEAYFYLSNNKNLKPMIIKVNDQTHWFLKDILDNQIIDITVKQFDKIPDYSKAKGIGFLTKQPSKRAQILIDKIKRAQNCF